MDLTVLSQALAAAGAVSTPAADPFFNQTTLLLHGDGTNGVQNNTFLDGSSNNFTITRNGNTTQGTFSPFSQTDGYWSVLAVPNGTNSINTGYSGFSGTGDYTCSFWIYLNSWTGGDNNGGDGGFVYIADHGNSHPTYPIAFYISKAGKVIVGDSANFGPSWYSTFNSAGSYDTAYSIGLNAWHYIHIVRSSGTLSIYANGNLQFSTSQSNSSPAPYNNLTINQGNGFDGYISNFRFVTAAITSATPPTGPSSTSTSSQVLLTCASNRFIDRNTATSAKTVSKSGTTSIQPFSPFAPSAAYSPSVNGGSGYFDGSGDFLSVPDNAVFTLGTSDFCIETLVYPIGVGTGASHSIIGQWVSGSYGWIVQYRSNKLLMYHTTNGSTIVNSIDATATVVNNAWNHIAFVRSGNTLSSYVNGTRVSNNTGFTANIFNSTTTVNIARNGDNSEYLTGYLNGTRMVVGSSVYDPSQTTLTVPTAPLTAITNTSLLCNFTNAGIFDNTGKNNLETLGDAQIDTTIKKYGTGALKFDGTGDYLVVSNVANNPNVRLTGDYTIEAWVYPNSQTTSFPCIVDFNGDGTNHSLQYDHTSAAIDRFSFYVDNTSRINSAVEATGQWYHIAAVRSGTTAQLFVNGISQGTATSSQVLSGLVIAGGSQPANNTFNGYIDDLRITKGVARYTANFTPPEAPFPNQ